ncbi:hypothetical protein [Desulfosporosinus acidiphilus]|nr:hypothetical protein [Desulfosporosinus acidiphilus]
MKKVFVEIPYGVDHTLKVLQNTEEIITIVAFLHDIGAVKAQKKVQVY